MKNFADYENDLVTDQWGNPDIAYYEALARKERSDYIVNGILNGFSAAKAAVKHWFSAPAQTRDA
ncbi:MAG: RSP_7527 family protein [Saccharospirillum sp.]